MSDFDLVDAYFCKMCDCPAAELPLDARALVDVWHSYGLIQNGGIHEYLCAVGPLAKEVAENYRLSNLPHGAELIEEAYSLWEGSWPSLNVNESDPDDFRVLHGSELQRIETAFFNLEAEVHRQLASVVRQQRA